jgi:hypothetical protein
MVCYIVPMNYYCSIAIIALIAILGGIVSVVPPIKKSYKFILAAGFIVLGILGAYFTIQADKEREIIFKKQMEETIQNIFDANIEKLTLNAGENIIKPPRQIENESKSFLKNILSRHPGIIKIEVIYKDDEALRFAQEWYSLLKASKWEASMETFIEPGPSLRGILIKFHGDLLPPGTKIDFSKNPSLDDLVTSIVINSKGDISDIKLLSNPTTPKNIISLRIGINP